MSLQRPPVAITDPARCGQDPIEPRWTSDVGLAGEDSFVEEPEPGRV